MSFRLILALLMLCSLSATADLKLQLFDTTEHDRFYVGVDKAFIADSFDLSGVGRVSAATFWAVMISDSYFLSAAHFHPAVGDSVTFYHTNDPTGASETLIVESGMAIAGTDLWLGKFTTSVSSSVKQYKILVHTLDSGYIGETIYVVGQSDTTDFPTTANMRVGRNEIDTVETVSSGPSTGISITYDFDDPGGVGADEAFLISGDSGGPSFAVIGGELVLVGIHWFTTASPDTSGDTLVGAYFTEISAAMTGESPVSVPEPGGMALGALLLLLAVGRSTRKRAA